MSWKGFVIILLAGALFSACCRSGDEDTDSTSSTGSEGDFSVSDLSLLPDLNTIASKSDTTSASLSALTLKEASVGSTSSAGCMAINFFKPTAINRLKHPEFCYLKATQDAVNSDSDTTNDMNIPTDSFGYYQVKLSDSDYVRFRAGNFSGDSGNTFRMDVCNSSDGTTFSCDYQIAVTSDLTNFTWSGSVKTFFTEGALYKSYSANEFTIRMASAEVMEKDFDLANLSTESGKQPAIDTTSYYGRTSALSQDAVPSFSEVFGLGFTYDAANQRNKTVASFVNSSTGSSINGQICAEFNATEGASVLKYGQGGTTSFSDTEGFKIVSGSKPTVISTSDVDFFGAFACSTLPDSVTADGVRAKVAFSDSWDASVPEGSTLVQIDGSAIDYKTCDDIVAALSSVESHDASGCFESGTGGSGGSGSSGSSTSCTVPKKWRVTMSSYTTTCTSASFGPPTLTDVTYTFQSKTDTQLSTTAESGNQSGSQAFTKSGDIWAIPASSSSATINSCTFSAASSRKLTLGCNSCSVTEDLTLRTATSGASCTTNTGPATPVIGTAGTCTETYTSSCTVLQAGE